MNDIPSTSSPLHTRRLPATDAGITEAATILRAGGLVAMPTETVYGLAADATSPAAVARIYAAKGRPAFNPLIAHVATLGEARNEGVFSREAEALAHAFWPGPLTLVTPVAATGSVCELARAGLASVALRLPRHALARELIAAAGVPLAAPSANISGHVSPTTPAHVLADLDGLIDAVIMAGPCPVGVESTIIACLPGDPAGHGPLSLLRAGGVAAEEIEQLIGHRLIRDMTPTGGPVAPGQLAAHYATRAPLRLNAAQPGPGEAFLGFGPLPAGLAGPVFNLSEAGDLTEAAARLYAGLRALDALAPPGIAAAPIPDDGLGLAINDRLARAAVRG